MSLKVGEETLLTAAEVAERTRLAYSTVCKYAAERRVFPNAAKIAGVWAIPESDLEGWKSRTPEMGRPRDDEPSRTAEYQRSRRLKDIWTE